MDSFLLSKLDPSPSPLSSGLPPLYSSSFPRNIRDLCRFWGSFSCNDQHFCILGENFPFFLFFLAPHFSSFHSKFGLIGSLLPFGFSCGLMHLGDFCLYAMPFFPVMILKMMPEENLTNWVSFFQFLEARF